MGDHKARVKEALKDEDFDKKEKKEKEKKYAEMLLVRDTIKIVEALKKIENIDPTKYYQGEKSKMKDMSGSVVSGNKTLLYKLRFELNKGKYAKKKKDKKTHEEIMEMRISDLEKMFGEINDDIPKDGYDQINKYMDLADKRKQIPKVVLEMISGKKGESKYPERSDSGEDGSGSDSNSSSSRRRRLAETVELGSGNLSYIQHAKDLWIKKGGKKEKDIKTEKLIAWEIKLIDELVKRCKKGKKDDDEDKRAREMQIYLYEKFLKINVLWKQDGSGSTTDVIPKLKSMFNGKKVDKKDEKIKGKEDDYLKFLKEVFDIVGYGFTQVPYANHWVWYCAKRAEGKKDKFIKRLPKSPKTWKNAKEKVKKCSTLKKALKKIWGDKPKKGKKIPNNIKKNRDWGMDKHWEVLKKELTL